jgi:hypothetical protein
MDRNALFDLAVNRSLSYIQSLGIEAKDKDILKQRLEVWYLKTRFAYRVSLDDIVEVLQSYPGTGTWAGGKGGMWQDLNKS